MEVRIARNTDAQKVLKYLVPDNFTGYVVEEDGRFMGMGLLVWAADERPYVFFNVADETRHYKHRIARWSIRFLNAVKRVCDEVYVLEDTSEEGSTKWIEWLGFHDTGEKVKGLRVMKWQKQ
jgi:hypothetical protein